MEIYLDNSATTPVCPEAAAAVMNILTDCCGNPSSTHQKGIKAAAALSNAREKCASVLSAQPDEIYFSPSGTVANNTAIFGAVEALKRRGNRIVTTSLEHPSVSKAMEALEMRGFDVVRLCPARDGSFSPDELFAAVNKNTVLVSIMAVNNEIGSINRVSLASEAIKRSGSPALLHVDAVQAFGKLPIKPKKEGIDLLTASSHKIHGPKGAGLLYIKNGVKIKPYIVGGGQENGMFSGTEAMPAIAGFGAACAALPDIMRQLETMRSMRNYAAEKLTAFPGVDINSPREALPYILNISVAGVPSEVMINHLSASGIYVSAGSACKKGHRSEVLAALGLPAKRIDTALRISMSRYTGAEDIDLLCRGIENAIARFRK